MGYADDLKNFWELEVTTPEQGEQFAMKMVEVASKGHAQLFKQFIARCRIRLTDISLNTWENAYAVAAYGGHQVILNLIERLQIFSRMRLIHPGLRYAVMGGQLSILRAMLDSSGYFITPDYEWCDEKGNLLSDSDTRIKKQQLNQQLEFVVGYEASPGGGQAAAGAGNIYHLPAARLLANRIALGDQTPRMASTLEFLTKLLGEPAELPALPPNVSLTGMQEEIIRPNLVCPSDSVPECVDGGGAAAASEPVRSASPKSR